MKRDIQLLLKAQKAFRNLQSPFHHSWLADNKVTSEECYSLSNNIATAIGVYAKDLARANSKNELAKQVGMEHIAQALVEEIEEEEKE